MLAFRAALLPGTARLLASYADCCNTMLTALHEVLVSRAGSCRRAAGAPAASHLAQASVQVCGGGQQEAGQPARLDACSNVGPQLPCIAPTAAAHPPPAVRPPRISWCRLAQAKLALGQWAAAVVACKQGEQLAAKNSEGHTEFTPLLDRTAVQAARAGILVGFDGQQLEVGGWGLGAQRWQLAMQSPVHAFCLRLGSAALSESASHECRVCCTAALACLQVRCAGDDAWLGGPAPHVPELDGTLDEDMIGPATTLALPSTSGAGAPSAGAASASGSDALAAWDYRQTVEVQQRRRTSYRSIREAVAAARDSDRILLRRGTHNGMG